MKEVLTHGTNPSILFITISTGKPFIKLGIFLFIAWLFIHEKLRPY